MVFPYKIWNYFAIAPSMVYVWKLVELQGYSMHKDPTDPTVTNPWGQGGVGTLVSDVADKHPRWVTIHKSLLLNCMLDFPISPQGGTTPKYRKMQARCNINEVWWCHSKGHYMKKQAYVLFLREGKAVGSQVSYKIQYFLWLIPWRTLQISRQRLRIYLFVYFTHKTIWQENRAIKTSKVEST